MGVRVKTNVLLLNRKIQILCWDVFLLAFEEGFWVV